MKAKNERYLFGFWENTPYGIVTDGYKEFEHFNNSLSKEKIINHIEALDAAISSEMSTDIFTGEQFHAGLYDDGDFTFPVDFLRYYKTKDIGIPYEYENYLKTILR